MFRFVSQLRKIGTFAGCSRHEVFFRKNWTFSTNGIRLAKQAPQQFNISINPQITHSNHVRTLSCLSYFRYQHSYMDEQVHKGGVLLLASLGFVIADCARKNEDEEDNIGRVYGMCFIYISFSIRQDF